jgi:hypothetical protein
MQSRARMQLLDTIDAIVNGVGRKDAVDLTRDYTRYQVRLGTSCTIVGTEDCTCTGTIMFHVFGTRLCPFSNRTFSCAVIAHSLQKLM